MRLPWSINSVLEFQVYWRTRAALALRASVIWTAMVTFLAGAPSARGTRREQHTNTVCRVPSERIFFFITCYFSLDTPTSTLLFPLDSFHSPLHTCHSLLLAY